MPDTIAWKLLLLIHYPEEDVSRQVKLAKFMAYKCQVPNVVARTKYGFLFKVVVSIKKSLNNYSCSVV